MPPGEAKRPDVYVIRLNTECIGNPKSGDLDINILELNNLIKLISSGRGAREEFNVNY